MSLATIRGKASEQRFVLHGVAWETYQRLRDEPESYRVRMTYDRGSLELMSPSMRHASISRLIEWLIHVWCEATRTQVRCCGDMTFRREDLERGLEPDNCYYLAHESLVRDREEIDLTVDPPPDLATEVEVTRRALDRLAIYAAMKVPEVWRTDGNSVTVHVLRRGRYVEVAASKALPGFPISDLPRWLVKAKKIGETAMIRRFRQWVAERK